MPKMHVEKSIVINASVEKIAKSLTNFNEWRTWSPWLIMEPETKVEVAMDGKSYSWEGKRVGTGNMSIDEQKGNEQIDYKLNFVKPWKSKADVQFKIKPNSKGAHVTWSMNSSLPFFMFWMKKQMEAFVGMDYERGLNMLKEHLEDGKVNSILEFKGITEFPPCDYLGVKTTCNKDEMGDKMKDDYMKVYEVVMKNPENIAGNPFTIYNKMDMVNGKTIYTACVPVKSIPTDLPEGVLVDKMSELKVNTVRHTGPYTHLGNPWMAGYAMGRNKEFKINKSIPPFEVYFNSPKDTANSDLITEINIPAK